MGNDQKLKALFMQLFSYEFLEELRDTSFFAYPINMNARSFLILFMEVEKVFSIRIPDEVIGDMKIDTYNSLLNEIDRLIMTSDIA